MASRKITEFPEALSLQAEDFLTGIDVSEPDDALKNVKIQKALLGFMLGAVYDPTAVGNDCFDLSNHHGSVDGGTF